MPSGGDISEIARAVGGAGIGPCQAFASSGAAEVLFAFSHCAMRSQLPERRVGRRGERMAEPVVEAAAIRGSQRVRGLLAGPVVVQPAVEAAPFDLPAELIERHGLEPRVAFEAVGDDDFPAVGAFLLFLREDERGATHDGHRPARVGVVERHRRPPGRDGVERIVRQLQRRLLVCHHLPVHAEEVEARAG